jgi:hypothetical protein
MLSLDDCRQILGPDAPASDQDLEALRDRMYRLARLTVDMARVKRQQQAGKKERK